jgi:hypothetical protein
MALRPIDFPIVQRRPSIIESAFGTVLQEVAQLPFQKAAENRAEKRQIAGENRGLANAFDLFQKEHGYLETQDLAENYAIVTPDVRAHLAQAHIPVDENIRTHNGQDYIPKTVLAKAAESNAPVDTQTANVINNLLGRVRGLGEQFTKPANQYTVGDFSDLLRAVSPELELQGLEQNDANRRAQLQIAAQQRHQNLNLALFNALNNFDHTRALGFGVPVVDDSGNYTGAVRPLTLDEQQAVFNGGLEVLANDPDFKDNPAVQKYVALKNRVQELGGIQAIPTITQKELDDRRASVVNDPHSPLLSDAVQIATAYKLARDDNSGTLIVDPPKVGAWLKTHPSALSAILSYSAFRGMDALVDAQKLPQTAHFDQQTLKYLSQIYRAQGLEWRHPALQAFDGQSTVPGISAASTPDFSGLPGQGTGAAGSLFKVGTTGVAPSVISSPLSISGAGGNLKTPEDSAIYAGVVNLLSNRFRAQPALVQQFTQYVDSAMASPESAAKFLRDLGRPQEEIDPLVTGTEAQRSAALRRMNLTWKWAVQDAQADAFRK